MFKCNFCFEENENNVSAETRVLIIWSAEVALVLSVDARNHHHSIHQGLTESKV